MPARTPPAPPGLGTEGRSFWRDVVKGWVMTPDGLRLLARAAKLLDTLATLDDALKGAELILEGSRGQAIANPILTERRLHELAFAQICRQLRLEDEEPGENWSGLSTSERARKAANARWRKVG